mgnify:CR=1 FL=1|tara:strand:+ start:17173 stop:17481 length:309 start_codon:yes stop_codon:yes gene_type:complete
MDKELIEQICGPFPSDFVKPELENNPDYVFENDLNYEAVTVYDLDGNAASVNSFLECEHYVSGGWDVIPKLLAEAQLYDFVSIGIYICLGLGLIYFQKNRLI